MPPRQEKLNERQREAADQLVGPLLIVAGAGAGKTKTIAERVKNLILTGVDPPKILAVTFTNKAAAEMKQRIRALIAGERNLNLPIALSVEPFTSTFHSLGVHILREQAKRIGLPRFFKIFDRDDSKKAVKEAMGHL